MSKTTTVFGDLTALYSARSRHRKPINYELLDSILKESMGVKTFDENYFYTLFSDQNEKQVSFIAGLKKLEWNVQTMNPRDVPRGLNWQSYRFDAQIAYQLGLGVERALLVTDSFDLLPVIEAALREDKDTEISLAFFSESLDGKWWKKINGADSIINFIDLDEKLY